MSASQPTEATRGRRWWPWVTALGAIVLIVLVVGGLALASAARTIKTEASAAQAAITTAKNALADGNLPTARKAVGQAEASVAAAREASQALPLRVAGALPVVSAPVDDVGHLLDAADGLVSASDTLVSVYGAASGKDGGAKIFQDGTVDLARVKALSADVERVDTTLTAAVDSLNQVSGTFPGTGALAEARDSALAEAEPLRATFDTLAPALPQLPDALGADGPKRYLLAVLNPAELRASGGAPLSVAILTFTRGRLEISDQGQTSTEILPGNELVSWKHVTEAPFPSGRQVSRFVNANVHPDFRKAGEELTRAWRASGKAPVDGVVAIDTAALVAVLQATGPVSTQGFGKVTADNLVAKLIASYEKFTSDGQRQSINDELATAMIDRLTGGDQLLAVVRALASVAPGRHLQLHMQEPALQQTVEDVGFGGMVSSPTGDHAAWFSQNGNASKTDVWSRRSISVQAQVADDGGAAVRQRMRVTNATPAGFGDGNRVGYLTAWNYSSWMAYLPAGATDAALTVPAGWADPTVWSDGMGRQFLRTSGWLDGGRSADLELTYSLPAGTFADGAYRLTADPQPILVAPTLEVTVSAGGTTTTVLPATRLDRIVDVGPAGP